MYWYLNIVFKWDFLTYVFAAAVSFAITITVTFAVTIAVTLAVTITITGRAWARAGGTARSAAGHIYTWGTAGHATRWRAAGHAARNTRRATSRWTARHFECMLIKQNKTGKFRLNLSKNYSSYCLYCC